MGLSVALETGIMTHTRYWSRTKPTARRLLSGSEIIALGASETEPANESSTSAQRSLATSPTGNFGEDL